MVTTGFFSGYFHRDVGKNAYVHLSFHFTIALFWSLYTRIKYIEVCGYNVTKYEKVRMIQTLWKGTVLSVQYFYPVTSYLTFLEKAKSFMKKYEHLEHYIGFATLSP